MADLDDEYRAFVGAQAHANLWHDAEFLTAACVGEPGRWSYATARDEAAVLAGVLPYRRKRRRDGWTVHLPPLVRYSGPLLRRGADRRVYRQLLDAIPGGYVSFDQAWGPPGPGVPRLPYGAALAAGGFSVSLRTTHLTSLIGDVGASLAKGTRYEMRRANRLLTVREVEPDANVHECLEASLRRRDVAVPYRRESVDAIWASAAGSGRAVCHGVYLGTGELAAASFAVADEVTGYALLSGARDSGRKLSAGTYAHYADMLWAQRMGCARFDFLGSDDPGIALNRRHLGGVPTPYAQVYKDTRPWTRALRRWRRG